MPPWHAAPRPHLCGRGRLRSAPAARLGASHLARCRTPTTCPRVSVEGASLTLPSPGVLALRVLLASPTRGRALTLRGWSRPQFAAAWWCWCTSSLLRLSRQGPDPQLMEACAGRHVRGGVRCLGLTQRSLGRSIRASSPGVLSWHLLPVAAVGQYPQASPYRSPLGLRARPRWPGVDVWSLAWTRTPTTRVENPWEGSLSTLAPSWLLHQT